MELLKILPHYNAMSVQCSLTGTTTLKQTVFKKRHGGSKQVAQRPDVGFIHKNTEDSPSQMKPKRKKLQKLPQITTQDQKTNQQKTKYYTVNKKEVSHRIRNFVNAMRTEHKLYFWTITFPAGTSDDTAFICFNKWLTRVRKELNLKSYLWITERQDGKRLNDNTKTPTNTIHFHIAIHQRMCVQRANRYMRACLFTCIDNGQIIYDRRMAKNYNGVDIAKDRTTKRVINFAKKNKQKALTNYLTKYLSKSHQSFTHLAWHCSRDYSNLITSIRLTLNEFLSLHFDTLSKEQPIITCEWYEFTPWNKEPPPKLLHYLAFANQKVMELYN